MSERSKTALGVQEDMFYQQLMSGDVYDTRDALVGLGMTHLAMEPAKITLAVKEIWAGMHSRTGLENLGIIGLVAGYIAGGVQDPRTLEYAEAFHRDRATGDL